MPGLPPPATVFLALLWLGGGLALLLGGAELFVVGSVRVATRMGLPTVTVGLTLVAVGTSLPELGASLGGVLRGGEEGVRLALGNALGSNVANIGLLLGLAALFRPLAGGLLRTRRHAALMVGASLLVAAAAYGLGRLPRLYGVVGLAGFCGYTAYLFRPGVRLPAAAARVPGRLLPALGLALLGGGGVALGAEALVRGGVALAGFLRVPADVVGASLVAVGTSLPELAVSVSAARRGEGGILLGNLVGSNVANLLLVLGACALVRSLAFEHRALVVYVPAMLAFTLLMAGLVHGRAQVGRGAGALLLVLYGVYLFVTWRP